MLTPRYDEALSYAAALHRDQVRKVSNIPYIAHLLCVSALVLEHSGDEDQAIAGLLHDAVEDQGGLATADQIGAKYGPRVRSMVLECSDNHGGYKAA
ncbi:HD domain-containing protein [Thetidibacter halocola]|uniref:HD domain-containing protein n=1 Tax=Thetidibacter halocola TaxID=2827239 RepID=A0A8J7WB48_9RHOB|nr:HD domain-containing protein [Thetidibacter halocola]